MNSNSIITRQMYKNLLPLQIITSMIPTLSGLIDSIVVGNFFDLSCLAVIGFIGSITFVFTSIGIILSIGVSIEAGHCIGRGEYKKLSSIYSTAIVFSLIISIIVTVITVAFSEKILSAVGVTSELMENAKAYLLAIMFGFLPSVLNPVFSVLLDIGNNVKYSMRITLLIALLNSCLSVAFAVFVPENLFFIGFASTVSLYVGSAFLGLKVIKSRDTATLKRDGFDIAILKKILYYGFPASISSFLCSIRLTIINKSALSIAGCSSVAALSVFNTSAVFIGSVITGVCAVDRYLASIAIGEQDRDGLESVLRCLQRISMPLCLATAILYALLAKPIALTYGVSGSELEYSIVCIRAYALSYFFDLISCTVNDVYYSSLGRNGLAVGCNVLQLVVLPFVICSTAKILNSLNLVYLTYFISSATLTLVFIVIAWNKNGYFPRRLIDILWLDSRFDASDGRKTSISVRTLSEAAGVSEKIMNTCTERGIDHRRSYFSALCVEEITMNILDGENNKNNVNNITVDLFVSISDDRIRIRIRDNAPKSNPLERMNMYEVNEDDVFANIGIRIVSKISQEMSYKAAFNMNVLSIIV